MFQALEVLVGNVQLLLFFARGASDIQLLHFLFLLFRVILHLAMGIKKGPRWTGAPVHRNPLPSNSKQLSHQQVFWLSDRKPLTAFPPGYSLAVAGFRLVRCLTDYSGGTALDFTSFPFILREQDLYVFVL